MTPSSLLNKAQELRSHPLMPLALASLLQGSMQSVVWIFLGARIALLGGSMGAVALFYGQLLLSASFFFCVSAVLFSRASGDLRSQMRLSFFLLAAGFGAMALGGSWGESLFPWINGASCGVFWASRHGMELLLTRNGQRDKYIASLSLGGQALSIALPALVGAAAALLESAGRADPIIPLALCVAALAVPAWIACGKIPLARATPFAPKAIALALARPLSQPADARAAAYWVAEAVYWGARLGAFPLAAAACSAGLGSIGAIESSAAAIAWVASALLMPFWKPSSRFAMLLVGVAGAALGWAAVGLTLTVAGLAVFTISKAFFQPIADVGNHTYSQQGIEALCPSPEGIMPALCARETWLLFGRLIGFGALASLSLLFSGAALALAACAFCCLSAGVYAFMAKRAFGPSAAALVAQRA